MFTKKHIQLFIIAVFIRTYTLSICNNRMDPHLHYIDTKWLYTTLKKLKPHSIKGMNLTNLIFNRGSHTKKGSILIILLLWIKKKKQRKAKLWCQMLKYRLPFVKCHYKKYEKNFQDAGDILFLNQFQLHDYASILENSSTYIAVTHFYVCLLQ